MGQNYAMTAMTQFGLGTGSGIQSGDYVKRLCQNIASGHFVSARVQISVFTLKNGE